MGLVDATRCHPEGCCHPPGPARGTGVPPPAARICPCLLGRGVPKNRAPPAWPLQDEAAPLGCGCSPQPLAGATGRQKGMEDIWGRGLLCVWRLSKVPAASPLPSLPWHRGSSEGRQVLAAAVQGAEGKNAAFPCSEPSIHVIKGPLSAWLLSAASRLS